MANTLTSKRRGWRGPILAGAAGVMFFVAFGFSRLTNPPLPMIVSVALGGLGFSALWFYLKSGVRDREERMIASLSEIARRRLRKQRPFSIGLAVALIVLVVIPFGLAYFARWIDPPLYNAAIGVCLTGMVFWCVAATIGHSARHAVLDEHEHELALAESNLEVRYSDRTD